MQAPRHRSQAQDRSGEHQSNLCSSSSSSNCCGAALSLSSSTWRGGRRIVFCCCCYVASAAFARRQLQQKSLMLLSSPQRCVRASEEFRGDRLAIKQARETPPCHRCNLTTASALCSSADGKRQRSKPFATGPDGYVGPARRWKSVCRVF